MSVAAAWYEDSSAYDWHQDWNQRLGLAAAGDTVRGLFFNSTLAGIRKLGGEELAMHCLESSGQKRFVDSFTYPVSLQLRMISTAMETLSQPYGGPEGVLRHLGRCVSQGFLESAAGRMMVKLTERNPKRLVDTLPSAYRVSLSYGKQLIQWTGPRSGRLLLRHEFMPHPVHEGVLATLLETGGAHEVKVWGHQTGPLDCECEFTWS